MPTSSLKSSPSLVLHATDALFNVVDAERSWGRIVARECGTRPLLQLLAARYPDVTVVRGTVGLMLAVAKHGACVCVCLCLCVCSRACVWIEKMCLCVWQCVVSLFFCAARARVIFAHVRVSPARPPRAYALRAAAPRVQRRTWASWRAWRAA